MKLGIEKTAMIRVRAGSLCPDRGYGRRPLRLPTEQLIPLGVELLEVPEGAGPDRT